MCLYYIHIENTSDINFRTINNAVVFLNEICPTTLECYVLLAPEVWTTDGRKVRGKYLLVDGLLPCFPDCGAKGIIVIDENCKYDEICTILVHEYCHHLTQQNDGGMLFELFKEWLRDEFVRRWSEYVERGKD